jgi:hypothetical protein
MVRLMAKTRQAVNVKLDIYMEGRQAALDNKPRFAPYRMGNSVATWFAGYDSVKLPLDKVTEHQV